LGGEKISWNAKKEKYKDDLERVTGDSLLCTGIIAYLGPFFISYREHCIK
jgi:dynein heavy chain